MVAVPDASVILKWVLPRGEEPGWESARRVLEDFVEGRLELAVPSLWYFEAGNILARRFGEHPGSELLHWLLELGLPEVSARHGWGSTAVGLVAAHGVTFYDAAYLAVAETIEGTLVTADDAFVRKVQEHPRVIPLRSFEPEA